MDFTELLDKLEDKHITFTAIRKHDGKEIIVGEPVLINCNPFLNTITLPYSEHYSHTGYAPVGSPLIDKEGLQKATANKDGTIFKVETDRWDCTIKVCY